MPVWRASLYVRRSSRDICPLCSPQKLPTLQTSAEAVLSDIQSKIMPGQPQLELTQPGNTPPCCTHAAHRAGITELKPTLLPQGTKLHGTPHLPYQYKEEGRFSRATCGPVQ